MASKMHSWGKGRGTVKIKIAYVSYCCFFFIYAVLTKQGVL